MKKNNLQQENEELKKKIEIADRMNKEQLDLILYLQRQIIAYENMNKVKRL